MKITIPHKPVPCPRPRVTKFGTFYPKNYKDFKKDVSKYLKDNYPLVHFGSESALAIHYIFIMPRPKYLQKASSKFQRINHSKKPDLDNLIKAINDTLQDADIIYDDSRIVRCSGLKQIASKDEEPHIVLVITEVENG
tara:strand:- start:400 stop:813 length:414 start_codon:yes stop_codon:yes gene_type:complete